VKGERQSETASGEAKYASVMRTNRRRWKKGGNKIIPRFAMCTMNCSGDDEVRQKDNGKRTAREVSEG